MTYLDASVILLAERCVYLEPYDEDGIYYWLAEPAPLYRSGRVARDVLARVLFPTG